MTGDRLMYLFQKRDKTEQLIRKSHLSRLGSVASDLKKINVEIDQILGA